MHFRTDDGQVPLDSDPALQYFDDVFVESWKDENEMLCAVLPNIMV